MSALMYLLQVNLYLFLFYCLYFVLLRQETFFKMNRFYLVGSALLSLAIPLMKLQWVKDLFGTEQVYRTTQKVSYVMNQATASTVQNIPISKQIYPALDTGLTNIQLIGIIYMSITAILLLNFFRKLYHLNRTLKLNGKNQAFSFFNIVSVDPDLVEKDTIIKHEMVHVRQWHSIDIIFFEIFAAFNWFNPIAFWYKRAITDIHEFIADDTAASTMNDKSAYTLLLVSNVFGAKPQQLTNSFFNQSLIKRRIMMLHKTKSRQVAILKYGLSVPLFALMILISSATIGKSQPVIDLTKELEARVSGVLIAKHNPQKAQNTVKVPAEVIEQKAKISQSIEAEPLDYKKVDDVAEFPGGVQSLYEWFKDQFQYPQAATNVGMDDRIVATFIIEKDGSLSNIKIVKDAGLETKEEALKVLQNSPKWTPAKLKGEPVRMSYTFPVNLKIAQSFTIGSLALKENSVPLNATDTAIAYFKNDRVFIKLPSNATYPGGSQAFNKYLSKNLKFPIEAKKNKKNGVVTVTFTVNKDGSLENIAVNRGIGHGCDEEAIRLVKNSGKWEPGKYDDGVVERTGQSVDIIFLSSVE